MNKFKKQIYLASSADFISGFGNGMFSFAIDLYVLRESSSPLWFAGTQIISPLIAFFLSNKVGELVDKYKHKTILKYAYIAEFFVTLFYFVLLRLNINISTKFLITLIVLILINILNLVEQSAYQASVVHLVPDDHLQQLNSLQRLASSCAQIFSPALGAALYSLIGMDNMISIRIVTIVLSLTLMLQIDFNAVTVLTDGKSTQVFNHDFKIFSTIKKERKLLYAISMSVGVNIFLAISNIALPFMMLHILKFTNEQYGLQQTMVGIGSILAGLSLSVVTRIKDPIKASMLAMLSVSASLLFFGIISTSILPKLSSLLLIYTFSILMGFSLVSMEIPMSTYMQSSVPEKIQGRVFSFMFGASQVAMPIGTIIATTFAYKPNWLLIVSGIIMFAFVIYNYIVNGRSVDTN
ncbi:MFS transporter [Companilactobacillus hulinensis]|uniref:MFS transporter n=1 Tax=Companilactobacillus hulinensis TaxID=2486007 RepID=UPI000F77DC84|nr:MFS transporter [Companilactobacillus hulinensis]